MPKTLQVRDLPDEVHRRLKVRAAAEGRTLTDLVRAELAAISRQPTMGEMLERLADREPAALEESSSEAIRAGRSRA